ncbi:5'-nucleotidase C-terminal domain-containing protein [Lewinella sp. JB7]|uniref:5'-nucleotidase C-terminal domain-containing protein n=1 Tax=Lewinella sp. JB7 TaxID=2962887 RepID=UPI0020C9A5FF|nr:5'-nucleotidase [Lewinella sp. JB7]MCP9235321.1 5'-nucleotidase C-terminal domain-containing protein [Lewinella sp. JB7]
MTPFFRALLPMLVVVVVAVGCHRKLGSPEVAPELYSITDSVGVDTSTTLIRSMQATIRPYASQLDTLMNRVLAEVRLPLLKGQPESSLGNWTADLIARAAEELFPDHTVAFAVQNQGGLRVTEIGTGPLLVSELYALMPFDNELVLVALTGTELREFMKHTLNDGGWPVSDRLRAERRGSEINLWVDGQPVADNEVYYVAMPDYVANGGSDAAMLVGKPQIGSGRLIRDLLIEYAARSAGPIAVVPDGSRTKISD